MLTYRKPKVLYAGIEYYPEGYELRFDKSGKAVHRAILRDASKPMSFWTEQDVLHYLRDENIPYCSVYGDIVASDGENDYPSTLIEKPLHCTGCQRTGCMFCGFGAHLEKGENRFERMKHTHPKHYDFCIGGGEFDPADGLWKPNEKGLGYGRVLDFIGVRY